MIGLSYSIECLCYGVVALQVMTIGANEGQPVKLEDDDFHEEHVPKRARKRAQKGSP